jgi:transposase-like protein
MTGSLRQLWRWVRKFSGRISVNPSRIVRRLIALDETCVKVNGLEYWVYAALDVDRNEIYEGLPIKKYSYHQQFIDV